LKLFIFITRGFKSFDWGISFFLLIYFRDVLYANWQGGISGFINDSDRPRKYPMSQGLSIAARTAAKPPPGQPQ
jgi:hypothetical protein